MSIAPSPADPEPGADGLVDMERELTRLLIEYNELQTAWPKSRHVLVRARIGRQVADTLARPTLSTSSPRRRQGHRQSTRYGVGA